MAYNDNYSSAQVTVTPTRNLEAEAKDHLFMRLKGAHGKWIWGDGDTKLRKAYGLIVEEPKSPKDFLDRIKNKQYTLMSQEEFEKECDEDAPLCFWDWFSWRDPAVKEDREGYEAALRRVSEAFEKARDIIMVKSPEEGLKALHNFMDTDYTK